VRYPAVHKPTPLVHLNLLDRVILSVAPKYGINRIRTKAAISTLNSGGYITPGKTKRSMISWFTSGGSADYDVLNDLPQSRSGSRDLYMNTPVATAAIRRLATNAVSSGLSVQSRIDRKFLELSDDAADKWEQDAEREWKLWSTSKDCDMARTNTFGQLQHLAFLSFLMSGDVFAMLPFKKVDNSFPYSLRIQLIESDQISNPNDMSEMMLDDKIRGGVEVDKNGSPVAYHMRTKHPGDLYAGIWKWVRVSIFGSKSGRRNVLHIFNKERPGQRRGMPFLAPVLEQLKQLTRLSEAELMGAIVAAFFTVFIKNIPGSGRLEEGFIPSTTDGANQNNSLIEDPTTDAGDKHYEMGSGSIINLDENEEIDVADPKRPNAAFEPFFEAIVRQIGASLELPAEFLMQVFNTSYSAGRAAMIEAWKTIRKYRANFVTDFCDPIYQEFLTEAVINGRLDAPGFLTDPLKKMAWCGSRWGGPGQGQIDPMKETKASILRIRNHLSTHEDEAQAIGNEEWERTADRLAKEQKILEDKGLVTDEDLATEDFTGDTEDIEDRVEVLEEKIEKFTMR
jgi:lambda family phage portal protein